ncbi:peptidoglycan-associated lipoprotein Pal [Thiomicrorhabdus sp. ZW0627]|uniref:peptidoglycan-associated lipoprotein Pal n=1 Tax=Thiomicrorhabdus sp. ZW0627 TaxID=3039774 RepID=UPI002437330B|nr:peptidoglycan-associated lipoprotein Pal [Thiomicrorhabdus sp. ZW0627]MDG6772773.1 peptidoglycan-associated lipoprotein Pal [Thiomicrorhabdus sp. ZW0627]
MEHLKSLFTLALVAGLTACSSTPSDDIDRSKNTDLDPLAVEGAAGQGAGQNGSDLDLGVEIQGVELDKGIEGSNLGDGTSIDGATTYQPIVYFGYDQSNLSDENTALVKHYAQVLLDNPTRTVSLVGHTDERGTPEYNLALGERRAKAVAQVMMLFGVQADRIESISYGEEQPAELAHDEQAWMKNRRVEIKIH